MWWWEKYSVLQFELPWGEAKVGVEPYWMILVKFTTFIFCPQTSGSVSITTNMRVQWTKQSLKRFQNISKSFLSSFPTTPKTKNVVMPLMFSIFSMCSKFSLLSGFSCVRWWQLSWNQCFQFLSRRQIVQFLPRTQECSRWKCRTSKYNLKKSFFLEKYISVCPWKFLIHQSFWK